MRVYKVTLNEDELREHFGDNSLVIAYRHGEAVALECNPAVKPGAYSKQSVRHAIEKFELPGIKYGECEIWLYHNQKLTKLAQVRSVQNHLIRAIMTFIARVIGYARMMNWKLTDVKLTWIFLDYEVYLFLFENERAHLFSMSYVVTKKQFRRLVGFEVRHIGHGIGHYSEDAITIALEDKSIAFYNDPDTGKMKIIENELITVHDMIPIRDANNKQ